MSVYIWVVGMTAVAVLPREYRARFRRYHGRAPDERTRVILRGYTPGSEYTIVQIISPGEWYGHTVSIPTISLRPS